MRFEVITAVKISMVIWVIMLCGFIGRYNVSEEHTASISRASAVPLHQPVWKMP
jgi:hypothetical protein